MTASMHHRGPDDRGHQTIAAGDTHLVLGNVRLAVIDTSAAGHMPMTNPETGNWITYNGEVYNYAELRAELRSCGVRFHSHTDTEVILKAYEQWGVDAIRRLRGMFAFAIWDAGASELLLARDRAGKKPLYYCRTPEGGFAFASELRALLASGIVPRRLNPDALEIYLFNGHMVSPETMIRDVYSVMPSHWMRVNASGASHETTRYWHPPAESDGTMWRDDSGAVLEDVRSTLAEAVRLRLIADVPLGAFLSGGLDSSAVVALMAAQSSDVRTFSIVFDETEYDESSYSHWVADHFKTRHSAVRISQSDFVDLLPQALDAMDQPSYDGANTYCVSQAAREHGMTVALSGLGGDELFGGYHEFRVGLIYAKAYHVLSKAPALRSLVGRADRLAAVSNRLRSPELLHFRPHARLADRSAYVAGSQLVTMKFNWLARQQLIDDSITRQPAWFGLPEPFVEFIAEPTNDRSSPLGMMSRFTSCVMMSERLMRDMDTMSSAVSLELRAPLTDHVFVESAWRIPSAVRCSGAPHKPMEMELLRPFLPATYPYRKKQGFVFPFERWVRTGRLASAIDETLNDTRLAGGIGLNPAAVRRLAGPTGGHSWYARWTVFSLMRWCEANNVSL